MAWLRGDIDYDIRGLFRPACGATIQYAILETVLDLSDTIPTCPACAVLRDAALEGRQDNGPAPHSADPSIDAR
jgi:hypothetical protein